MKTTRQVGTHTNHYTDRHNVTFSNIHRNLNIKPVQKKTIHLHSKTLNTCACGRDTNKNKKPRVVTREASVKFRKKRKKTEVENSL